MTSTPYLFCDLETSGLDPDRCSILEVAAIIDHGTGGQHIVLDRVIDLDTAAVAWDPMAFDMHQKSGLIADLSNQAPKRKLRETEDTLLETLASHPPKSVILAGNTISFDQGFIKVHMPRLYAALHYRLMDVSALITFFEDAIDVPRVKQVAHRALPDVKNSVLTYTMFKSQTQNAFYAGQNDGWEPDWTPRAWGATS